MGISISDVIENELLSEEVIDCIPHECESCGSEIEFTDSLKQIYCPNRFCSLKIGARLEAMAKAMKADGWGESTCRDVCSYFRLKSPYQVFLLEKETCDIVSAFEKKVASICDMQKRRVKLWEVVRLAGIPSVETIAYKIFDGYDNLTKAYEDIEKLQVPFIADKLGLRNADTGVLAVNVYNTLIAYKDELLFGETMFDIYKPTGETFYVAITGGVSGFTNKSEYVNFLNRRYNGKVNVMFMNSVTHTVNALVADGDTSSNKYKTATKVRQKQEEENDIRRKAEKELVEPIVITDSRGLIDYLDNKFINKM